MTHELSKAISTATSLVWNSGNRSVGDARFPDATSKV
jgi:hypothetical protein